MHLFEVEQPQVVLEVAGRRVESEVLASYRESPNFTELVRHLTVVRVWAGARMLDWEAREDSGMVNSRLVVSDSPRGHQTGYKGLTG